MERRAQPVGAYDLLQHTAGKVDAEQPGPAASQAAEVRAVAAADVDRNADAAPIDVIEDPVDEVPLRRLKAVQRLARIEIRTVRIRLCDEIGPIGGMVVHHCPAYHIPSPGLR